ncbi:MAG: hypothetical protein FWC10_01200 [Lentimicrobiaceae bacterium]|nr:hypothetical protein [Lentimicrobiaceae bacterium]
MTENLYKEFDEIFNFREQITACIEEKYEELLENVKRNTNETKYGTANANMYLGFFCPSLVMDKTTDGFTKGRLLKSIQKNNSGNYVIYDIDNKGRLLRMQDINSYGTIVENYVIRERNTEFSVTFIDKKLTIFCGPSTRTIYKNGKLERFDIIDNSSIWSEIYTYNPNDNQNVECRKYYYVPNLKGSKKFIPIGIEGSPARLFIMDIKLDNQGKVIKIEHNELIDGRKVLTYIYEK